MNENSDTLMAPQSENMAKEKRILVTGTIAYDHLMQYPSTLLQELREVTMQEVLSVSFEPTQYVKRHGGTGANIAWNVALLGGHAMLVANVGPDGAEYVKLLKERGIDVRYVEEKQSANTSTGICCTDTVGHQIWFFYRGADTVGHWPDIAPADHPDYAIIGARHQMHMLEALEWCAKTNTPSLFDPGQEILRFTPEELLHATTLATGTIMNEFEWGMFTSRVKKSAQDIVRDNSYLIITKGEEGYVIVTKDGEKTYPRCNCENPINPTGAGDAFRAGLVHGLTSNWSLEEASKLGAAIASFVVEQEGTLLPGLNRELVQSRVKEAYGEELADLVLEDRMN